MNATVSFDADPQVATLDTLHAIEERVLWLSTAMIHHANRVRPNSSGLKVGGHQASSASMVTIMTALWFEQLQPGDRVSVNPHASPVLHSLNYLLGELDERYLTTPSGVRWLAVVSESVEGPRSCGLLHRLGGNRGDRADLGRDGAPLHRHPPRLQRKRAPVLVGRRRRARRGCGVGGHPRSGYLRTR